MKSKKNIGTLLFLLFAVLIMSSCQKRVPCPAYAQNVTINEIVVPQ